MYDLIVVGAGPTGLSIAAHAERRGVERVLVVERGDRALPAEAVARYGLTVRYGFEPVRIERLDRGGRPGSAGFGAPTGVVVESETESLRSKICVVVTSSSARTRPPAEAAGVPVAPTVANRIHVEPTGFQPSDQDVLVWGDSDEVVASAEALLSEGARVVVVFSGQEERLSRVARETLAARELERRLTVFWNSAPSAVSDVGGFPMVHFDDRHMPALQFDHLVVHHSDGDRSRSDETIHYIDATTGVDGPLAPARAWQTISDTNRDLLPPPRAGWSTAPGSTEIERLRLAHYNATITRFDHYHDDLWVIRVRPDRAEAAYRPGQYATLGLGYWEPRADDADEGLTEQRRIKLIRRSYSISSPIFDDHGYLADPSADDEMEFYIVHVRPNGGSIPALTPRLATKRVGDRIYLGPKMAGRYTLDPVTDPTCDVVFLGTGTGEAPHNAMATALLRKGHRGSILAAVTVRYIADLGYIDKHRRLEEYFANYHYLAVPTREPDVPKRYLQDLVSSGELDDRLDHRLDPAWTHVYLCGNPAMIGIPTWSDGIPTFPEPTGVVQLLHERGFTPDRRGVVGNVHFEEYW